MRLLWLFVSRPASFWGALLFAVHPIHAEAVSTVYGQQDLLAAVFFLSALVVAVEGHAAPSIIRIAAVNVLYLLSLLCKEQGVLLPLLLLLLGQRVAFTLLIPLSIYAILRVGALGEEIVPTGPASIVYGYPWWARINLVLVTIGTYLRLLVLPWGQTTYYGHLRDSLFGWPLMEVGSILGGVVLFTPLQRLLGRRVVWSAVAFLAITLLPVANLLPIGVVVAERCLYLPAAAVSLLAAAGMQRAMETRARLAITAASILVVVSALLSVRVAVRWRTPLIHWETTASDHPRSAGAHARFALLLLHETALDTPRPDDPRLARAEQSIERASQINPRLPEAWHARGVLALLRGDCTTAAPALDRALALRPGDREIVSLRRRCP
jgi:hypothetical protein